MFTTILTNLQSLISARFVVASFLPALTFGFVNALMLFWLNAPFHDYVVANVPLNAGLASLILAASLIAIAFLAYIQAALLPTLQSVLEGNWPAWIVSLFVRSQVRRYERLDLDMRRSAVLYGSLSLMSDSARLRNTWRHELAAARDVGAGRRNGYMIGAASAGAVQALDDLQRQGRFLTDREIRVVVRLLRADLSVNDAGLPGPEGIWALDSMHHKLLRIIDLAEQRAARCKGERDRLRQQLADARRAGSTLGHNTYRKHHPSAQIVEELAERRRTAQAIQPGELRKAVGVLVPQLRANNADRIDISYDLEDVRDLLGQLIDYADEYARSQYRSISVSRQFEYGSFPLAPTRMGNVARTVQNYTVKRYDFNFTLLWSRLQFYAQKDTTFGGTLQAAKTQFDFLISCCAWIFVWTVAWTIWLGISRAPVPIFLGAALLGPVAIYGCYHVAVAQYRSLTDLLRSSVDLFRFDLLAGMHHPPPGSVQEEIAVWTKIDGLHARYELEDLRYLPGKTP